MTDTTNSFQKLFAPEDEALLERTDVQPWKILLVDDEPDIHSALHLALQDIEVEGNPLALFDAHSAAQARTVLETHPDIALILLDVVMENDHAGLDLVLYIREKLHNRTLQIIVLTGQPGHAPQRSVISNYLIDGYRLKSELTADRIFVTVYAALRTYKALCELLRQRKEQEEVMRLLREQEERMRSVVETAPDAIILTDDNGTIFEWNEGATRLFGYSREEIIGSQFFLLELPERRALAQENLEKLRNGASADLVLGKSFEINGLHKNGTAIPLEIVLGSWVSGVNRNFSAIIRDISERRRTEDELRLAASVYANSSEGILITDAYHLIVDANPAFSRITGIPPEEVVGRLPWKLEIGLRSSDQLISLRDSLGELDFWQGEIDCNRKDGQPLAEVLSVSGIRNHAGACTHYIYIFSDVSLLKARERELVRVANFDTLTGLPNRRLLSDRLRQAMAHSRRSGRFMAICYLDLDSFKSVNDSLGHSVGDRLLIEISERLKILMREEDTLARMGGDEFVLLINNLESSSDCHVVLDRILQEMRVPIHLENTTLTISASIGVTIFPDDDADTDALFRHADQAMYAAKDQGKNSYCFFDAEHERTVKTRRLSIERLSCALHQREFILHYQPKVDLFTGRVVGAEALIRWQHPERGLLYPADFLFDIENSELNIPVGEWVISEVMRQIAEWRAIGLNLVVSANVSAPHLLHPEFAERLQKICAQFPQTPTHSLELEILETSGISDMKRAAQTIAQCRKLGVRFSLDDFGTGYSSLTYFLKLPVQELKIDQSFVRGILDDPNQLGIVESVVRLARAFNRPVIAEGAETLKHCGMLRLLGCTLAQGYGISRPVAPDQFLKWLDHWNQTRQWQQIPTLHMEGDIVLTIARQSYTQWMDRAMKIHQHPEDAADVVIDSSSCAFGRWYAGSGSACYIAHPSFLEVGRVHEQSHDNAERLLTASQDEIPMYMEALQKNRERMIVLLDQLE